MARKKEMKEYLNNNEQSGKSKVIQCFKELQDTRTNPHKYDITKIFNFNVKHPALFPYEALGKSKFTIKLYLNKWLNDFYHSWRLLPSQTKAKAKSAPNDPDVRLIVQKCKNMTKGQAMHENMIHNLFMSAENIQGILLEEYIHKHSYHDGWIWARGKVVRACDFVNPDSETPLIQIKNKYNSENSSSSNIRRELKHEGVNVHKWFRLPQNPDYNNLTKQWSKLNNLMDISKPYTMSNTSYQKFLTNVVNNNPNIITSK